MTALKSVDPVGLVREQLESASPDVLRAMVKTFTDALMSAEADAICGAPYGQRSDERTNQRNGYRQREWDSLGDRHVAQDPAPVDQGQGAVLRQLRRGDHRRAARRPPVTTVSALWRRHWVCRGER